MKGYPTALSLCVAVSSLVMLHTEVTGRHLRDLRQFRQIGVGGRFVVNRDALERIISDSKEDGLSSNRANFALPCGLPRADYDEEIYGELVINEFEFQEPYSDDGTGLEVETHRSFYAGAPFVSGGQHGMILIFEIANSSTATTPVSINRDVTSQADSVDVDSTPGRETVTYRSDSNMIRVAKEYNTACGGHVGDDFDVLLGKSPHFLNSHGQFDWGCDEPDSENSGYCDRLEAYEGEIDEAGGDVCVVLETSQSTRRPASMTIEEVTGEFAKILSDLKVKVPATSFEAEWIDRVHQAGIKYPCLN